VVCGLVRGSSVVIVVFGGLVVLVDWLCLVALQCCLWDWRASWCVWCVWVVWGGGLLVLRVG